MKIKKIARAKPVNVSKTDNYLDFSNGLSGKQLTVTFCGYHDAFMGMFDGGYKQTLPTPRYSFISYAQYNPVADRTVVTYIFPYLNYGLINIAKIKANLFRKRMQLQIARNKANNK